MPEYDCRRCKTWKGCEGKPWYHYGEIRWCPQQVIWILQNAATLHAGLWLAPPDDSAGSTQINPEAYFVKAGIAISELEARLPTTPDKGELLITQVEDGRSLSNLSDGARAILMYVKGFYRKDMPFNEWQRQKRYRRKMTTLP